MVTQIVVYHMMAFSSTILSFLFLSAIAEYILLTPLAVRSFHLNLRKLLRIQQRNQSSGLTLQIYTAIILDTTTSIVHLLTLVFQDSLMLVLL